MEYPASEFTDFNNVVTEYTDDRSITREGVKEGNDVECSGFSSTNITTACKKSRSITTEQIDDVKNRVANSTHEIYANKDSRHSIKLRRQAGQDISRGDDADDINFTHYPDDDRDRIFHPRSVLSPNEELRLSVTSFFYDDEEARHGSLVLLGKQPENDLNVHEGEIRRPVFNAVEQGNSPPVPEPKKVKT